MSKRRGTSSMVGKGFAAGKITIFGPYGTPGQSKAPMEVDLSNEAVRKLTQKKQPPK